jgi:hypothetical protein
LQVLILILPLHFPLQESDQRNKFNLTSDKMKAILLLFLFGNISICLAQDSQNEPTQQLNHDLTSKKNKKTLDLALEGMVGVSVWNDFIAINVGGPSLKLRLTDDLAIGVGALPSLYRYEGRMGARLGVSPRIDYKQWVLIAPFLHMDNRDEWVFSVGFGYKFSH